MNHNQNTDVQFEDSRYRHSFTPQPSRIIQWVMKYSGGLIQNEKQASLALLVFTGVAIITTLFLIFGAIRSPSPPPTDQIIDVAGPTGER